jgi:hypothetical protein
MSFLCPNQKYDGKSQKANKHPNDNYKDYGFYHIERAIIAPRIAPSMQAPKNSFMSISYFTRY